MNLLQPRSVPRFGHGNEDTYLIDDDFSDALIEFPPGCRILIVTDCCHSGTIADLDNAAKCAGTLARILDRKD